MALQEEFKTIDMLHRIRLTANNWTVWQNSYFINGNKNIFVTYQENLAEHPELLKSERQDWSIIKNGWRFWTELITSTYIYFSESSIIKIIFKFITMTPDYVLPYKAKR